MCALSCSDMSDSCNPMDCSPPGSSVPGTGLSRQEYWSGLPFPPPRDLPLPRIKLTSLASPMLPGGFFTTEPPGKPYFLYKSFQTYGKGAFSIQR